MKFIESINAAILDALRVPSVVLLGQLVKYGLGGMTSGAYEQTPDRVITYPVCENLMNASAMGLALAGMRPIVVHERMDFLAVGMDPLVNHIPVWTRRERISLPIVVVAVVGKGKGQGPQHSKNLAPWFRALEGWTVVEPDSPEDAYVSLWSSVFGNDPVLYVVHREAFGLDGEFDPPSPSEVGLCGASERHEAEFYGRG